MSVAKYTYEWLIKRFAELPDAVETPAFALGFYTWRLRLQHRQAAKPQRHVSLYLHRVTVRRGVGAPPPLKCTFVVKNWKDPTKDHVTEGKPGMVFNFKHAQSGSKKLILRDQLMSIDAGFLRCDGSLLLRLELEMPEEEDSSDDDDDSDDDSDGDSDDDSDEEEAYPAEAYPAVLKEGSGGGSSIGSDFLSLLADPGPTTDLTITATAAVAGGVTGAGKEGGSKKRKADTASSNGGSTGASSRRFPVHRAILAARCPYFATHFASGLGDSNTRELHMPDTDPDALTSLLRFVYGGELHVASREQASRCLALADRLLLPKAAGLLRAHLLATLSPATVMADLMWATGLAEGQGQAELLTGLVDYIAEHGGDIPEAQVEQLAAAQPALMAKLFTARVQAAKRCRVWKAC